MCYKSDLLNKRDEARKELPWELVLFNLEFLNHFGFNQWSELSSSKERIGFYLAQRNIIEIKKGNKRLARFYANELSESNLLFPFYNTVECKIVNESSLTLLEYETGFIMSYSTKVEKSRMDDLIFHIAVFAVR